MRGAPPVRVDCGPDRRWRAFEAVVFGAALASGCGWMAQRLGYAAHGLVVLAGLAAGAAMLVMWRRQASRPRRHDLAWSGEAWTLDGAAGRPQVMLDFGGWLLLRFCFDGRQAGVAWVPVDLSHLPDTRHLLRTALHAPAPRPDAGPPAPGDG